MRQYRLKNPKGSTHPLYPCWNNMKARCYNEKHKNYKNYGQRGIGICEAWRGDFFEFCEWAIEHGWKPDLTIDRIDNDGDYSPDNCRFITRQENVSRRTGLQSNNSSGVRGVSGKRYRDGSIRWVATVWTGSKNKVLGTFKTVEEAANTLDEYRSVNSALKRGNPI